MPDICMCEGNKCTLKENCYRFKATPDKFWQSYFTEEPFDEAEGTCDYYWKFNSSKPCRSVQE